MSETMSLSKCEWKECKFSEVLIEPVRNGIYKKKEFHGRGTNIVNMGELFKYPRLFDVQMKKVEITKKERSKVLLNNGDLIFARRSLTAEGAGKCSLIKKITKETTFESSIIRARPDNQKANSDFLFYYFNSFYGKYLLGTILRQVAVSGITGSDLMELIIKLPPLPEQKDIAEFFSSLDDKIDLLYRQNKTLEQMAETLFRQWFVVEAKKDWEERPLSSIATFLNGLACQKYPPKNEIDKLPVLKIKELRNGFSDDCDWCTTDIKPEYIIENSDIIFAWSASLMVKIWDGETCILNQHLFKVTSDEFPQWYYYLWSKHHLDEFISISASHATTMGHIKRGDLDDAMVLVPPSDEIAAFSEIQTPIIDKIIANNKQLKKLIDIRDQLLPKLMSGEVRVV